ncbi:MAG: SH3 domain-containing protein [Campylobacteraceae bacterium]|jgi:hypothetical protein|nr:SH3 domain-containing protein [Campylobacteraceae bacterium]
MRFFIYFCIIFFVFTGCSVKEPTLKEVLKYEQKAAILSDAPILSQKELEEFKEDFLQKYFAVWDEGLLWTNIKDASFGFEFLKNKNRYAAENRLEVSSSWVENIERLSNFDSFGSVLAYAITTQNANLRLLPTDKPLFRASAKRFDYPFDYLQNSFISIMQPVIVSHYSADFAWAFVESSFASGWLKSNEIAIVDKQMIEKFKNAAKIVVTKDNAVTYYEEGLFAYYLKAGTMLPIFEYKDGLYKAFIIATGKDTKGFAVNITISEEFAKPFPLEFNSLRVKQTMDELLNENYGWGGLYANRDCSAFTKDFFSIFGIWLPRNSRAQKGVAPYFDVSNLTATQKEQKLKEFGIPYLTLVYLPGHIMLYVGEMEGKAVIAHNIWGIRTKDNDRYIIGKSVITDLYLGENVDRIDKRSLLINRMQGFTILAPKSTFKN